MTPEEREAAALAIVRIHWASEDQRLYLSGCSLLLVPTGIDSADSATQVPLPFSSAAFVPALSDASSGE